MLACGQSYKASTLVHYDSRVISISNLLEITTRVVIYERKMFIRLATETVFVKRNRWWENNCCANNSSRRYLQRPNSWQLTGSKMTPFDPRQRREFPKTWGCKEWAAKGMGSSAVWPDWTLGNFSKPGATISLPKSITFLDNFCKGFKIFNFF